MNVLLTVTLLVSGLCSLSSSVPRHFHVVSELKSWTEAQQYCREEFTDLATIDNMAEMEEVKRMTNDTDAGDVWIGLEGNWQWSLADRDFYRKNEAEFRNWGPGQPDGGRASCVLKTKSDGQWHDANCVTHLSAFICYDGKNSTQPYVLVKKKKNWEKAQSYCREKHTDLATVRNKEEDEEIQKKVRELTGLTSHWHGAWIGLFRDETTWQWSDGSNSSFRHWVEGQPSYDHQKELCTVIQQGGRWNDVVCHLNSSFICYEDKLVLVNENKTWNEALQHCQDHNMDLVSVRSERIQRWVTERAKGASTDHVWLGLRQACGLDWFWVYGETVCYSNWAPGQEQVQDCQRGGAVKSGAEGGQEEGQWVSLPETEKLNFICTTEEE